MRMRFLKIFNTQNKRVGHVQPLRLTKILIVNCPLSIVNCAGALHQAQSTLNIEHRTFDHSISELNFDCSNVQLFMIHYSKTPNPELLHK